MVRGDGSGADRQEPHVDEAARADRGGPELHHPAAVSLHLREQEDGHHTAGELFKFRSDGKVEIYIC